MLIVVVRHLQRVRDEEDSPEVNLDLAIVTKKSLLFV